MKIEVQNDCRIAVELSGDDLSRLAITYEELDYSNIETRRVLWTVLDEASQTIGCDINLSERLLIEAVPLSAGGCVLYFTVLPKTHGGSLVKMVKGEEGAMICDILNLDDLFSACARLKQKGYREKSELYAKDSRYRLVLYPNAGDEASTENALCEYGDILRRNKGRTLAHMKEHWNRLASPDAVDKF